jgi:hypothetical protein
MTEADERHLRRAIELASAARAAGDMPYGSLLVGPAGSVLAEERNTARITSGPPGSSACPASTSPEGRTARCRTGP